MIGRIFNLTASKTTCASWASRISNVTSCEIGICGTQRWHLRRDGCVTTLFLVKDAGPGRLAEGLRNDILGERSSLGNFYEEIYSA